MRPTISFLTAAAIGAAAALLGGAASAADAAAKPTPAYMKDRADCDAGRTAQDRVTCLKEAGAAAQERKRNGLDNAGSPSENALARCNALTGKDKTDCVARIDGPMKSNQQVTTSGSVSGGGIIRETKTTTTGPAVVIEPMAAPASAPK